MNNTGTPTPKSRAAAHLALGGVSGRQLAARLGVTPQAVSFHLAGRSVSTPPELLAAVEDLTDAATRAAVDSAIIEARHAKAAES